MGKYQKIIEKILLGQADKNIDFKQLCQIMKLLGFTERIRGSHHIFVQDGIKELVNLQEAGKKAKPYQVRQVRKMILKYHLEIKE